MSKKKSPRADFRCDQCAAACCRDLPMMITKPKTSYDVKELKWNLKFDTVNVFIRGNKWYMLIKGKCIYLDQNNLCTIYDVRPKKCRDHEPPNCEHYSGWYDTLLTTPEELEEYLQTSAKNGNKKKKITRKSQGPL